MIETFLSVLIVLVVVGIAVWAIKRLFPMDPPYVNGLNVLSVVFVAFYVIGAILHASGYFPGFPVLIHK